MISQIIISRGRDKSDSDFVLADEPNNARSGLYVVHRSIDDARLCHQGVMRSMGICLKPRLPTILFVFYHCFGCSRKDHPSARIRVSANKMHIFSTCNKNIYKHTVSHNFLDRLLSNDYVDLQYQSAGPILCRSQSPGELCRFSLQSFGVIPKLSGPCHQIGNGSSNCRSGMNAITCSRTESFYATRSSVRRAIRRNDTRQ